MMYDFTYYNPTKIYFGKNALDNLPAELERFGKTVLLVYGKGSVKKLGLYDQVMELLSRAGKRVVELPGIQSNPTYAQLQEGARLVREHQVDLILAVGGGSVIDCSKGISVSAYCEGDPWQRYWVDMEEVDNPVVPVGSILTMAGTGSEMNGGSVITNEAVKMKNGRVFEPEVYPKFSILNPEYTYTVPQYQMVSGIFDTMSHLMEQYFSGEDDNTTDYLIEGILDSLIHSAREALADPHSYQARSNIMWCATLGLNTMTGLSKTQDWEVHNIEHQIGAYTNCAHGAGLAVVSPHYYRAVAPYGLDQFVRFAQKVWKVDTAGMTKEQAANAGIDRLEAFIQELGLPATLRELGVTGPEMVEDIANSTYPGGGYKKLETADILEILKQAY